MGASMRVEAEGELSQNGLWMGIGAPANSLGNRGDYYLRIDAGASTHLYFCTGAGWTAVA